MITRISWVGRLFGESIWRGTLSWSLSSHTRYRPATVQPWSSCARLSDQSSPQANRNRQFDSQNPPFLLALRPSRSKWDRYARVQFPRHPHRSQQRPLTFIVPLTGWRSQTAFGAVYDPWGSAMPSFWGFHRGTSLSTYHYVGLHPDFEPGHRT